MRRAECASFCGAATLALSAARACRAKEPVGHAAGPWHARGGRALTRGGLWSWCSPWGRLLCDAGRRWGYVVPYSHFGSRYESGCSGHASLLRRGMRLQCGMASPSRSAMNVLRLVSRQLCCVPLLVLGSVAQQRLRRYFLHTFSNDPARLPVRAGWACTATPVVSLNVFVRLFSRWRVDAGARSVADRRRPRARNAA